MSTTVLITGATGFIASHTIAALLEADYHVIGTVRRPDDSESTAHLRALPGAADRLRLVGADLATAGAFDGYAAEADYVLHMASPFHMTVADPQTELLEPAVTGTRNLLAACAAAPRVQRVVLTSSMAAITDEPEDERVLSEADWNVKSSLTRNPYYYSKAEAERTAWQFVERTRPHFDLVTINPFIVIGPAMTARISESNQLLVDLMNGVYPAIMALTWGFVDVRDVAAAHVRAMTAAGAKGRYLCAAATLSMREVVALLRERGYGHTRLPRFGLDSGFGIRLARLAACTQPKGVASYLRTHLGRTPRFDNGKIQRDLDLRFRPVDASIVETCADLVGWGHVKAGKRAA